MRPSSGVSVFDGDGCRGCGFGEDVGGEDVRQMMFTDDDFYVDSKGVWWAKNLEDAAFGGATGGRGSQ